MLKKGDKQALFINQLRAVVPASISLVDELMDILDISMDSAYRRIRSETSFSFDEIYKLCNHYNISFDSLSEIDLNSVTFKYKALDNKEAEFIQYLESILMNLEKLSVRKGAKVLYACRDIPFFYHFKYPVLASFKLFYWMKSVMNVNEFQFLQFDKSIISDKILETGTRLYQAYIKIPSVEIWTEGTLDSLIKQLEYSWEAGFFKKKEDAEEIRNLIAEELVYIRRQAALKAKFADEIKYAGNEDNFELYISDIEIGNNTIIVTSGDYSTVFLTHHTFNNLQTSNSTFVSETEKWFSTLKSKSTLVSGVSEKHRNVFFNKISNRLGEIILK